MPAGVEVQDLLERVGVGIASEYSKHYIWKAKNEI
jgi:hypothetical protein